MDQTLDQIIAARPRGSRRGGRGGRRSAGSASKAAVLGNAATPAGRAKAAAAKAPKPAAPTGPTAQKIIVSNLPLDVTETQIKELFSQTVGPLGTVNLHHDAGGRSKGIAEVHFRRAGDGNKAHQQYHNRLIDGS